MKLFNTVAAAMMMAVGMSASASAVTIFTANLTEGQEVSPVSPLMPSPSGTAILTLNDAMDRLEIEIQLFNLDLDGLQTPGDLADDVTRLHLHAAPAGSNGGVVFGLIAPDHDLNGDLVIDPVAGTLFSGWDLAEGNATTLGAQLPALFSRGLYVNVHTNATPSGQIRGQVVSEPGALAVVAGGLVAAGVIRRRSRY